MTWLNIFESNVLHLVAETSVIVIGSILMGILLAYLHWSGYKKRMHELDADLKEEREKLTDLHDQMAHLAQLRDQLAHELAEEKSRYGIQSRQIYEQAQQLFQHEKENAGHHALVEQLKATIATYEKRLSIIEKEMAHSAASQPSSLVKHSLQPLRANYDRVSQMLGRQVTENDLTIISGVGTRTASLLQAHGIDTWDKLGRTDVNSIHQILTKAGGVYKSLDPSFWPKQAVMAANSEWRKLRVFQESIRKNAES